MYYKNNDEEGEQEQEQENVKVTAPLLCTGSPKIFLSQSDSTQLKWSDNVIGP